MAGMMVQRLVVKSVEATADKMVETTVVWTVGNLALKMVEMKGGWKAVPTAETRVGI